MNSWFSQIFIQVYISSTVRATANRTVVTVWNWDIMALRAALRLRLNTAPLYSVASRSMAGDAGSGAGKGGGTGGSIRDAGGAFGKMEVAQEEQYFRRLQHEQLKEMKKGLEKEVKFHEEQIKAHQEALKRHKARIDKIDD